MPSRPNIAAAAAAGAVEPYIFHGHRRNPPRNIPVVRGGFFTNRRTRPHPAGRPRPPPPHPFAFPDDPKKWDPHRPPQPAPPALPPSDAFLAAARRLSPVARFIADAFRRHCRWGSPVLAELRKLRRVTPDLVAEVLKAEPDAAMASRFFRWAGKQKGYAHTFAAYNAFTYCLNRAGRHRSADQVPELMRLQGKPPGEKQFEILIRLHADAGRGLRVFYVYEMMKRYGVAPRVFLYNRIMDALVRTNHLDLALSVYADFQEKGLVEESVTYMILAKGLCRASRKSELLELLGRMRSALCRPDVFAYTAMIKVMVGEGDLDGCLSLWEEMGKDGVQGDVMAYTTLVTALCKGKMVDKGVELFLEMKKKGFLIDRAIYGALIDGLVADGKVGSAFDLFKDMREGDYRPDLTICNSLIAGLCTAGEVGRASKLFKFTVQEGLVPEFDTVKPLLVAYAKVGRMDELFCFLDQIENLGMDVKDILSMFFGCLAEKGGGEHTALEVFQLVKEKGLHSIAMYNVLVGALHKVGDAKKALQLFDELKELGMDPDSVTYSYVIQCLVDNRDVVEACSMYNTVKENNLVPSIPSYCSLVRGLCSLGEISSAILLVRDCLGNVTNGPSEFKYTLTILHVSKAGTAEKVIEVLDEMVEQGIQLDDIVFSAVIFGLCKYGTSDEARKVFSVMKTRKLLSESNMIVYEELLVEHLKKTTAGLVISGLKFFGLENKWNNLVRSRRTS